MVHLHPNSLRHVAVPQAAYYVKVHLWNYRRVFGAIGGLWGGVIYDSPSSQRGVGSPLVTFLLWLYLILTHFWKSWPASKSWLAFGSCSGGKGGGDCWACGEDCCACGAACDSSSGGGCFPSGADDDDFPRSFVVLGLLDLCLLFFSFLRCSEEEGSLSFLDFLLLLLPLLFFSRVDALPPDDGITIKRTIQETRDVTTNLTNTCDAMNRPRICREAKKNDRLTSYSTALADFAYVPKGKGIVTRSIRFIRFPRKVRVSHHRYLHRYLPNCSGIGE